MRTITFTERQADAILSAIKRYADGCATLENSKGDKTCFKTIKGKFITAEEMGDIEELIQAAGGYHE